MYGRPDRARSDGRWNLGPVRIPPLPQHVFIEDRATGVWLHLTHEGEAGALVPVLSETLPRGPDIVRYPAFSGPSIGGRVRLFSEDGTLQAELFPEAAYSPPVYTRRAFERTFLRLELPKDWDEGDPLIWVEVTV